MYYPDCAKKLGKPWLLSFLPLLVIGLTLFFNPRAAQAQVCIAAGAVCTAEDQDIGQYEVLNVIDGCSSPTDTMTVQLRTKLEANAGTRYDIGMFVALDGDPVVGNGAACQADILTPLASGGNPFNATSGAGPYRNEDSDACGDINKTDGLNFYDLPQQTMACRDIDNNGLADFNACVSWTQNQNTLTCTGANSLVVGTSSKCKCADININVPVPNTGELEVKKVLIPNSDSGKFNLQIDNATAGTGGNVGHGGTTGKIVVSAGSHPVGETAGTNTNLSNYTSQIECVKRGTTTVIASANHAGPLNVSVNKGDDLVCTITNNSRGTITIQKETDPDGSQESFTFNTTATGGGFALTDGGSKLFTEVAGLYTFGESVPTGWEVSNIQCTGGSAVTIGANGGFDAGDTGVSINLQAGENVVCTFTNKIKRGTIVVQKTTVPAINQQFTFTPSGFHGNTAFTLAHGGQRSFANLLPGGAYAVSETVPDGWSSTAECVDSDLTGTASTIGAINLDPGETVTCTFTNQVKPAAIAIAKGANQTVVNPGAAVTYFYTVTNAGQTALTGVTVTDDKCSPVTGPTGDNGNGILEQNETWYYQCTTTLTQDTINTVTAKAFDPAGQEVLATAQKTVDVRPSLRVAKTANPTAVPESGGNVQFTVVVTNTSQEAVTLFDLVDSVFGNLNSVCALPKVIAIGNSYPCVFTRPLSGDVPNSHTNTVTATVKDDEENEVKGSASATVIYSDVQPAVTLTKVADPLTLNEPGGAFKFTLTIKNTSTEAALISDLTDDNTNPLDPACDALVETTLNPGQEVSCQYTVNHSAPGNYPNTASVTLQDDEGNTAKAMAKATVTVVNLPSSLAVAKTANPTTVPEPGGSVNFTVRITNTSAVDTVTLTQIADDTDNNGTNDLFYDAGGANGICNTTSLAPGAVAICSFIRTINGNAGQLFTDVVTALGTDDDGQSVSNKDDATVGISAINSEIVVTKTPNPASLNEPGGLVVFTVQVENKSVADTVTINTLNDSDFGDVTTVHDAITATTCRVSQSLPPVTGIYTCQFTAQVRGNFGQNHENRIVASGKDDDNENVADFGDALVEIRNTPSSLAVSKRPNPATLPESGGNVAYTVVVTNTSAVDSITINALVDNAFGDLANDCPLPVPLAPQQTLTCTFTRFIQGNFGTSHTNIVTASGFDDDNIPVGGEATARVTFTDTPSQLTVTKTATPNQIPESGGLVDYQIVVTNSSVADSVTVNQIDDNRFPGINANCLPLLPHTLAPGAKIVCNFSRLLVGDIELPHDNIVTARGVDDDGATVSNQASARVTFSDVAADATLVKAASRATVPPEGAIVTFAVRLENSSARDSITFNTLIDSVYGDVANNSNTQLVSTTCVMPQTLLPTQVYTCQFSATVKGAIGFLHTNILTATGVDDDQATIVRTDREDVLVVAPILAATKRDARVIDADNNNQTSPGDTLEYTVVIHNAGNTAATGVIFNDLPDLHTKLVNGSVQTTLGAVVTGNSAGDNSVVVNLGTLPPDGSATIRFRVLINKPLPAGVTQVANQGVVQGDNFPNTLTDDPDTVAQPQDPTVTPLVAAPLMRAVKSDQLLVDADNNGVASPGDTLEYHITLANDGNQAATDVVFSDTPGANTQLVAGTVQTTQGSVVMGNGVNDTAINVAVGTINGGQNVVITFRVTVNNPLPLGVIQVANQGFVKGGNFPPTPSDDPGTPDPDDPTVTPLTSAPRLEASKQDTLLVDADNNGLPSPGDTLIYNITLLNQGNTAATNLIFQDTPGAHTSLIAGTVQTDKGTVTQGNGATDSSVEVQIPLLAGGGAAVNISFLVLIAKPVAEGVQQVANQGMVLIDGQPVEPTDDPETVQEDDPTLTPITAAPQINVSKSARLFSDADQNSAPSPGDTLEYRVLIANQGNQAATAAILTDLIDSNTTLVIGSVQSSQGTVLKGNSAGDTQVQVDVGIIGGGVTVQITFRVTIANPLPAGVTQVRNQGLVSGGNFPTTPSDDPDTPAQPDPTDTPVVAAPRLSVSKRVTLAQDNDGNGIPSPGDRLRYLVTIINSGNIAATNVAFVDQPDVHTSLATGSVNTAPGTVVRGNNAGDNDLYVQIGVLPGQGGTATISFDVLVNNPLPATVVLVKNQGLTTSQELPPVPSDDPTTPEPNDPTATPVRAMPVLAAAKRATLLIDSNGNGVAEPGETLLYQITLVNIGNTPATGVVYSDTIDANTTLIANSLQSSQGTILSGSSASDKVVRVAVGVIPAAGGTVNLSYLVVIKNPLPSGVLQLVNQGVLTSQELPALRTDDPTRSGESDPTIVPVIAAAQLEVLKTDTHWVDADGDRKVTVKDVILYQITLVNTGNIAATNVVFQDTPDPHTTLLHGTVQTSQGTVSKGNNADDTQVEVNVGTLPANNSVMISFQVRIELNEKGIISNQATVTYVSSPSPRGNSSQPSDDPDTPTKLGDPTITLIDSPTALDDSPEPLQGTFWLYLPTVRR